MWSTLGPKIDWVRTTNRSYWQMQLYSHSMCACISYEFHWTSESTRTLIVSTSNSICNCIHNENWLSSGRFSKRPKQYNIINFVRFGMCMHQNYVSFKLNWLWMDKPKQFSYLCYICHISSIFRSGFVSLDVSVYLRRIHTVFYHANIRIYIIKYLNERQYQAKIVSVVIVNQNNNYYFIWIWRFTIYGIAHIDRTEP